jgi:hypothetical protein
MGPNFLGKKKLKFSLWLTKYHAMNTYWGGGKAPRRENKNHINTKIK